MCVVKSNKVNRKILNEPKTKLPIYPEFAHVALAQKTQIEALTARFEPYSDFNFTNLWAWDIDHSSMVSLLNGCLVLRLTDYDNDNKLFYTLIGSNMLDESARILIESSKRAGMSNRLLFVPEIVATKIVDPTLNLIEERHNFDYILSVENLVKFPANLYRGKKNLLNRFDRAYGSVVEVVNDTLVARAEDDEIVAFFRSWQRARNKSDATVDDELNAINRVLGSSKHLNSEIFLVYIESKLAGYTIYEKVGDDIVTIHFDKADTNYKGIFEYMKHSFAKLIYERGIKYINYEQDLGIEGLRRAKESYHPIKYLKKYSISER